MLEKVTGALKRALPFKRAAAEKPFSYAEAIAHKWPHQARVEKALKRYRAQRARFVGPPRPKHLMWS